MLPRIVAEQKAQAMDSTADLLRDTATRLFAQQITPEVSRAAERGVFPAAAWEAVEAAGLTRALVPEAAGGFGVPAAQAMVLARVAGEHAAPLPLAETMIAAWLLAAAGLPIPDGPLTVGPVAAEDSALHLTRPRNDPGTGWRLSGSAARTPWGRDAAAAVLLVAHAGRAHVALLRPDAWHLTPGENLAREPRDHLRVTAAPEAVAPVALPAHALRAAGAAARTQQIAGALARVLALTTQYAQDRTQFGRPIGKFQAVQQSLAVLAGQAASASAAADLAAEAMEGEPELLAIASAKARAGEAAGIACGLAHQLHGAIGFTYEHGLHFLTKRLWSWRDEFGAEAEWNRLLGRHMLAAGADRLWAALTAA